MGSKGLPLARAERAAAPGPALPAANSTLAQARAMAQPGGAGSARRSGGWPVRRVKRGGGAGLSHVSDESLIFVQRMINKFYKDGRPLRLPWRRGREAEIGTVATHRVHDDRERKRHHGGRPPLAALPLRRQFPTSSGRMPITHSFSPSSLYNFPYSHADRFSTAVWNAVSRSSDQTCPSLAFCQTACTWP